MNKSLFPAYFVAFVNVLGFSILIPILPFIVESFNAPRIFYGIIISTYALSMFFGAPIFGALSDKYGRKPMLLISQTGTLLSWVIFGIAAFVPNISMFDIALPIWIILFSRITDGITGGNISIVNAIIADISTNKEKTKNFGYLGAVFGVGFLIGPIIGSLSYQLGIMGVAVTAFIISFLALIFIKKYLRETNKNKSHTPILKELRSRINIPKQIFNLRNNNPIFASFLIRIVSSFSFVGLTSILSLFLIDKYSLESIGIGTFMFVIGIYQIFNQAFLARKIIDKIGLKAGMFIGPVLIAIGMSLIAIQNNLILTYLFSYFFALGTSISFPSIKAVLSIHTNKQEQGKVLGLDEGLMSLSQAIMPIISTTLYVIFLQKVFHIYALFLIITTGILYLRYYKLKL